MDELANLGGPSIHPNGLEIYVFETFANHRIWHATRESLNTPWSAPVELSQLKPGTASVFQPFIHMHGRTETLFMGGVPALGGPRYLREHAHAWGGSAVTRRSPERT